MLHGYTKANTPETEKYLNAINSYKDKYNDDKLKNISKQSFINRGLSISKDIIVSDSASKNVYEYNLAVYELHNEECE